MNKHSSYNFLQNKEKQTYLLAVLVVAISLISITLTTEPTEVYALPTLIPQITNCETGTGNINDRTYGECDQIKDRSEGSYDNCYTSSTANNCRITQTVKVSNNLRDEDTEAKILQEVQSLIDCDKGATYCLANTFNNARQNVDVKTYRASESTTSTRGEIDFDVHQKVIQKIGTDNQDYFKSYNTATQNFYATAKPSTQATPDDTAEIDADGPNAHIDQYITQEDRLCDDSTCRNTGTQTYDLQANGRSSITATEDQGVELKQLNNCDDTNAQRTIDCINTSTQLVRLISGNPQSSTTGIVPNSDASITFATDGPDDSSNMLVKQTNICEFGVYDCRNTADTQVQASAFGTSTIDMAGIEQNVDSTNNCEDLNFRFSSDSTNPNYNIGCQNTATVFSLANSAGDGSITITDGRQDAYQLNDCDNSLCSNAVTLFAGIGASTTGGIDPVTGKVIADYNQESDQINDCGGTANCQNQLQILYSAIAKDGTFGEGFIDSTSDQIAYQANYCYDQNCANSGILTNTIFAPTGSEIYSTVNQDLYQRCDTSDGPNCQNVNSLTISATSVNDAFLAYTATQNIDNTSGQQQNPATIQYTASATSPTNPYTPQPVTQTQPGTITNPPE